MLMKLTTVRILFGAEKSPEDKKVVTSIFSTRKILKMKREELEM